MLHAKLAAARIAKKPVVTLQVPVRTFLRLLNANTSPKLFRSLVEDHPAPPLHKTSDSLLILYLYDISLNHISTFTLSSQNAWNSLKPRRAKWSQKTILTKCGTDYGLQRAASRLQSGANKFKYIQTWSSDVKCPYVPQAARARSSPWV